MGHPLDPIGTLFSTLTESGRAGDEGSNTCLDLSGAADAQTHFVIKTGDGNKNLTQKCHGSTLHISCYVRGHVTSSRDQ